ncbi:MAG: hypothetical protein N0A16_08045 [Blastocatellia bacterium]|nr:hypothetical protein [Blastocatellia bacterium]MCS7157666.1 hypothetical protein [Blastocatellia bacterium]MCX7751931.1 hypothetical protein [Blastocatellia bacterium]MDW8167037.1 hypothetical protein [Acidobacteriota bacterium]MDW8257141.1 hypothetical protein [Acidobacteriota bacterium]
MSASIVTALLSSIFASVVVLSTVVIRPSETRPPLGPQGDLQPVLAEDECCGGISQGEFALQLAWALGLAEPPEGWTAARAARELERLGHRPEGGWRLAAPLREDDLMQMLRGTRFAQHPAAQSGQGAVTRARVRAIFRDGMPVTQGRFAQMLARALAPDRLFTVEEAVAWLRARGLAPAEGWEPDEWMSERKMWDVLSRAGWPVSSIVRVMPEIGELPVDHARAHALLFERRDLPTQAMLAMLLVKISGLAAPAQGWTLAAALAELERWNARPEYGWTPLAPVCEADLVRLLRRAGIIIEPVNRCRAVTAVEVEGEASVLDFMRALSPVPQRLRVIEGPIFRPLSATSLIVPLAPSTLAGNVPAPATPVPPEIVGPAIPSVYSVSRPRAGF